MLYPISTWMKGARDSSNQGGVLKTVTLNLKSVYNYESDSLPKTKNVPRILGSIQYVDHIGSKVMNDGN